MLGGQVSVHDIQDVEAFVRSIISSKVKLRLEGDERDELLAEGIAILLDLAAKYRPRMTGYDKDGSFAGYCAIYLPKKIFSAWHKWHPEHLLETQTDDEGKKTKRYRYGTAPASLNEHLERNPSLDSDRLRTPGDFIRS